MNRCLIARCWAAPSTAEARTSTCTSTRTSTRASTVLASTLLLAACADTHWERAFYEGARAHSQQAAQRPQSAAVPQKTELPSYDEYERERQRLRPPAP